MVNSIDMRTCEPRLFAKEQAVRVSDFCETAELPVTNFRVNNSTRAALTATSPQCADRFRERCFGEYRMPLVNLVITLAVIGVLLWLVNNYVPMQSQIKSILNGVVVIAVVLWLLKVFGLFGHLSQYRVGHL